ncbi:hypothetical protein ACH4U6_31310 [Streptomyces netropsis]|uniref:hypothetical protein n=1 Tax=Streptomyces netropsis TaxID=55404 RepID=UPI00379D6FC1
MIFGVHPSVQVGELPSVGDASLSGYLARQHDAVLRSEIALAEGDSRVVVLVGRSSTGKSRACWEAIRDVLPGWSVWHPLAPTRPTAVLEMLRGKSLRPRTVIWLDEMQLYLAAGPDGEEVASSLHELVQDRSRGPLLVLGSMWPGYIDQFSRESASDHAAARLLLRAARIIDVPQDFTERELTALHERVRADCDPGLRLAAQRAGTRVCQFLAGAPELKARYNQAEATTRAVVWAAMDARRLGHGRLLPEGFLRRAARGYLEAGVWDQADADWFPQALSTLTAPCLGVPGPLVAASDGSLADRHYKLADYLDQLGRVQRGDLYPPTGFWNAVAAGIADPTDLISLAQAAWARGRLRRAEQLFRAAAEHQGSKALMGLAAALLGREDGDDRRLAEQLYRLAADQGEPDAFAHLAGMSLRAERPAEAERLYRQAAEQGSARGLEYLADVLHRSGDRTAAADLYRRAADGGSVQALSKLAGIRRDAGDVDGEEQLLWEVADHGYSGELGALACRRDRAGDPAGAERLLEEASPPIYWRRSIADARLAAGDREGAERVLLAAVKTGDAASALHHLAELRVKSGDRAGAERAYRQALVRRDTFATLQLAVLREEAGDYEEAVGLLEDITANSGRAAGSHPSQEGYATGALQHLVWLRLRLGDPDAAYQAACTLADHGQPTELMAMGWQRDKDGDREGALRLFRAAADRGHDDAFFGLMVITSRSGDQELAKRVEREAAQRGRTRWLLEVAIIRAKAGDRHAAVELYRRAADGGNACARQRLSFFVRRPVDGVDVADHRLHPTAWHSDTAELVSQVWFREITGDQAGADAAALEAAHRGNHRGLINLAWLRADAGNADSADQLLQQAVDGGNIFALERLAESRAQAGDHPTAIALYRRAAAEGYTFAWQELAKLHDAIDNPDAADEAARQAALLGNTDALLHLAQSRETAGELASARRLASQAADCGRSYALQLLYQLVTKSEGTDMADRLRRFGLDDDGTVAAPPDSGPRGTEGGNRSFPPPGWGS